jgi:glutamine cyclotransferase
MGRPSFRSSLRFACAVVVFLGFGQRGMAQWASAPPVLLPEILSEIPHDPQAFTQGLVFENGSLYESTGIYGQSTLRQLDAATGKILRTRKVASEYFAEGLTLWHGQLIQLTWKQGVAFGYPLKDWKREPQRFSYSGEGWGLTSHGNSLWMSNGTDTLFRRDANFHINRKVGVTLQGKPLKHLNELEMVGGKILANVWYSDSLYLIHLRSGHVEQVIDASELVRRSGRKSRDDVLNGVAYDSQSKTFYLTGKNWAKIFRVRLALKL